MKKEILQVDAFTDKYFGGNPAGVVLEAQGLNEVQMQRIAREMNLSETAFVFPIEDKSADFHVRFFTPTQEVDLCGHATIATFHSLAEKGYINHDHGVKVVTQKTGAGILPVELYFENHRLKKVMMTQAKPVVKKDAIDISRLASILKIDMEDITLPNYPVIPQIISTGLPDIILPVKSLKILKAISPYFRELAVFSNEYGVTGVHAFTLETEEKSSSLSCRNFGPAAGIDEESATGTANGALGAYLVANEVFALDQSLNLICEQGYYMGRPSNIMVSIEGTKENMVVKVGGQATIVLEGSIYYE